MKDLKKKLVAAILCAVMLLVSATIAEAQQTKVYRVGVLGVPGRLEERPEVKGLRDGLREAGYVEGKNLQLSFSNVKNYEEVRTIAKDYVEKRVNVIVTTSGTPTLIARDATKEIPIIFIWGVGDPIESGLVKSLARPEANITGLTFEASDQMFAKRLELFKDAVPSLRRVALLYNARGENPTHAMRLALIRDTAPKLGLTLNEKPAKSVDELDDALRNVSKQNSDGIFILCSSLFVDRYKKINDLAIQKKLPVFECGGSTDGLLSYNPNRYSNGHRGAKYVDRLLKGAKPSELPVEQPTKFEFIINLKTAKQISLTIPPNVLARADKVIK